MKANLSSGQITIVEPVEGLSAVLEKLTNKAIVHQTARGFVISADKATLFDILHDLSFDYDIELV